MIHEGWWQFWECGRLSEQEPLQTRLQPWPCLSCKDDMALYSRLCNLGNLIKVLFCLESFHKGSKEAEWKYLVMFDNLLMVAMLLCRLVMTAIADTTLKLSSVTRPRYGKEKRSFLIKFSKVTNWQYSHDEGIGDSVGSMVYRRCSAKQTLTVK